MYEPMVPHISEYSNTSNVKTKTQGLVSFKKTIVPFILFWSIVIRENIMQRLCSIVFDRFTNNTVLKRQYISFPSLASPH